MKSRPVFAAVLLIVLLIALISGSMFAAPETAVKRGNDDALAYLPVVLGNYPADLAGIYSNFWPAQQHDAARTGHNAVEKELYPPLKQVWSKELGAWNQVENITAVDDDLAITGPTAGFRYNHVLMLDANNGSKKWDFTLPNGGGGSMLVAASFDSDSIYFGGQNDSHFYSLFRNNGAPQWQLPGFESLMGSQQVIANGMVYVPDSSVGVFALSAATGDLKWGAGYGGNGEGLPVAYRDGIVYGVRGSTELVAMDAASGTEKWTFSPVQKSSWIIADSSQLFVRSGVSEIRSLNPENGNTLYTQSFDSELRGPFPALAENRLFIPTNTANDDDPDIIAINAADGGLLWSYEYDPGTVSDLAVANGIVYFTGNDFVEDRKGVFALDAASGSLVWSASLPDDGFVGGLAISAGTLFVGYYDSLDLFVPGMGKVFAFRSAR